MGRRGCASAMGMIKFPSSCSSPKALCSQFIDYYICSRGVFCINHIKLRNFVVITIECSIATVDKGSIMTRIYRWSMMVYSSLQAEFMVTKYDVYVVIHKLRMCFQHIIFSPDVNGWVLVVYCWYNHIPNMCRDLARGIILLCFVVNGIVATIKTADYRDSGLLAVPENLNAELEVLILNENTIDRIANTSLMNYPNLIELNCRMCAMTIIEDGAFDYNTKIKKMHLEVNDLVYIPPDLGPLKQSLELLRAFNSMEFKLENLNFSTFMSLSSVNMGGHTLVTYDASNLPTGITSVYLPIANLQEVPSFSLYTPNVQILNLHTNHIIDFPSDSLMGLNNLTILNIFGNNLEAIPDLFDRPLVTLKIYDNPLRCNVSLCWVRMWTWKKTAPLNTVDRAMCHSPSSFHGKKLMEIDPVELECYRGGCN